MAEDVDFELMATDSLLRFEALSRQAIECRLSIIEAERGCDVSTLFDDENFLQPDWNLARACGVHSDVFQIFITACEMMNCEAELDARGLLN